MVVDEAHLLPAALLHQLRFLLNRDMDAATPFTLILLAQPELRHKLKAPPYEALLIGCAEQQRILDETALKRTLLELGDNI